LTMSSFAADFSFFVLLSAMAYFPLELEEMFLKHPV
jgi:hypothetical protein